MLESTRYCRGRFLSCTLTEDLTKFLSYDIQNISETHTLFSPTCVQSAYSGDKEFSVYKKKSACISFFPVFIFIYLFMFIFLLIYFFSITYCQVS